MMARSSRSNIFYKFKQADIIPLTETEYCKVNNIAIAILEVEGPQHFKRKLFNLMLYLDTPDDIREEFQRTQDTCQLSAVIITMLREWRITKPEKATLSTFISYLEKLKLNLHANYLKEKFQTGLASHKSISILNIEYTQTNSSVNGFSDTFQKLWYTFVFFLTVLLVCAVILRIIIKPSRRTYKNFTNAPLQETRSTSLPSYITQEIQKEIRYENTSVDCHVYYEMPESFENIANLSSTRKLILNNTLHTLCRSYSSEIQPVCPTTSQPIILVNLHTIKMIKISDCDNVLDLFAYCVELPKLKHFHLEGIYTAEMVQQFTGILKKTVSSLEVLQISGSYIAEINLFDALRKTSLKSLNSMQIIFPYDKTFSRIFTRKFYRLFSRVNNLYLSTHLLRPHDIRKLLKLKFLRNVTINANDVLSDPEIPNRGPIIASAGEPIRFRLVLQSCPARSTLEYIWKSLQEYTKMVKFCSNCFADGVACKMVT